MRKLFCVLFFGLSASLTFAQTSDARIQELLNKYPIKETEVCGIGPYKKVEISGLIRNYNSLTDSKIIKLFSTNVFTGDSAIYTSTINDNGTFRFDFNQALSQDFTLKYAKTIPVFINPGDIIYVELDPAKEKILFMGDNAGINSTMSEFAKFRKIKDADTVKIAGIKRKNYDGYKKYRSKWFEMEKGFNTEFLATNKTTPLFQKWLAYQADYTYAADLLARVANSPKEVPAEYYNFVYKFETNRPEALISSGYQQFISSFKGYVLEKKAPPNIKVSGKPSMQTFNYMNEMLRGIAREIILTQYFSEVFVRNDYDEIMLYKFRYRSTLGIEPFKNSIKKLYDAKDSVYNAASTNAIKPTISTKEGKEILVDIREKYKGKVILLCFWETTSELCRNQLPFCKQLQERYTPDKFAVIYMCSGTNETICKGLINELKLKGEHYYINSIQLDFMQRALVLSHYPFFVLVDKKGLLANKDADAPGDLMVTKKLNQILIDQIDGLLTK